MVCWYESGDSGQSLPFLDQDTTPKGLKLDLFLFPHPPPRLRSSVVDGVLAEPGAYEQQDREPGISRISGQLHTPAVLRLRGNGGLQLGQGLLSLLLTLTASPSIIYPGLQGG